MNKSDIVLPGVQSRTHVTVLQSHSLKSSKFITMPKNSMAVYTLNMLLHKETHCRSSGTVASNWDTVVQVIALDGADLKERDQCPAEYPLSPDFIRVETLSQNLTMVCIQYCTVCN